MHLSTARLRFLPLLCVAALLPGRTSPAEIAFEDVTVAAGVDYLQWDGVEPVGIFGSDREFLYMCGGASAGDYDNDGWPDLYVTRFEQPNLLFHNLQDGTFEEVGATAGVDLIAWSTGCAWGDVDNDGFLDLYVLTFDRFDRNYLYINDGLAGFAESAVARGIDFPETNGGARRISGVAFGDYDLNGTLDLMITEWSWGISKNLLMQNDGSGYFTDVTIAAGVSMPNTFGFSPSFADIDNDGLPDLLVAADFNGSRMFRNIGNGQFQDVTFSAGVGTDENGMGSAVGDHDNDGDLDWFVTSIYDGRATCATQPCSWGYSGNRLYRNDLNVSFGDATDSAGVREGDWGWGASFLDFDNDGDLDLGMTNGMVFPWAPVEDPFNDDPVRLWENDGTGVMTEVGAALGFTDTGSGKGFLVFDFDRDGDQDVFVANNAGNPVLYRNDGGNQNPWLKVSLRGMQTNRFGIGARVFVQTTDGGTTQMREISADSNYMSQNDVVAHIGLKDGVISVHSVRVEWPVSGLFQEFSNVAANAHLTIIESPKGDVNLDGAADTGDTGPMVSLLLGGTPTGLLQIWTADMNDDGAFDGSDLQLFVNAIAGP